MEVERKHYVYYLKHRETGRIFYVGATNLPPNVRLNDHLSKARMGHSYLVNKVIRGLLYKGQNVDLEIQTENWTKEEAHEIETILIATLGRDNLANMCWSYGKSKRKQKAKWESKPTYTKRIRTNSNSAHVSSAIEYAAKVRVNGLAQHENRGSQPPRGVR